MNTEKFIVGVDKFPVWFNDYALKGRAKVNYDDEGEVIDITIYSPTKTKVAHSGDTILFSKYGLQVVQKEKADKYIQPAKKEVSYEK